MPSITVRNVSDEVFRAILKLAGRQPPAAYDAQIDAIKAAIAIMEGRTP